MIIYNYITTNRINGKQYVGMHKTNDMEDGYLGSGIYFLKAIKKYGRENFTREILEFCQDASIARYNEERYIIKYNTLTPNGYNISPKGGIGCSGCFSEETLLKMSESHKGMKPMDGKKHTDEAKIKIGKGAQGREPWNKGKKGNKRKGSPCKEETKEKLRIKGTGRKHSWESKQKMRLRAIEQWKKKN